MFHTKQVQIRVFHFLVDMAGAGDPEHLEVEVYALVPVSTEATAPQKRRLPLQMAQIGPARYRFMYNPTLPEDHYIDIKFCGERIKGSILTWLNWTQTDLLYLNYNYFII